MKFIDFFRSLFAKKHKKIGVALGSGGAKGFALIGALKAFDEEGIKFDLVAGTSIGSIVGGLYACGYGWREMLDILREFDVLRLNPAKLLSMKLHGETVTSYLDGILGGKEFSDTVMPFCAVATNINTGERVEMKNGDLASAMAASSAICPPFRAVERRGVKLVDGAFVDAVPGDVVKDMGADFVVSLSLSHEKMNTGIKTALDLFYKGNKIEEGDRLTKGLDASDYVFALPVKEYKSTSLSHFEELFNIGYETVKNNVSELKELLKKRKILSK